MILAVNWTNVLIQTCMGIGEVFLVLILLVCVLQLFGVLFAEKKDTPAVAATPEPSVITGQPSGVESASEAEKAAIAMALHLYFNAAHDTESYKLTIKHNAPTAWNNKIFGINKLEK